MNWSTLIDVLTRTGLLDLANKIKMPYDLVTQMQDQIQALTKENADLQQQLEMKLQEQDTRVQALTKENADLQQQLDITIKKLQEQDTRAQQQLRQQVILIMCRR